MAFVPVPVYATDLNGTPQSGAKVYAFEAGTSTPQATYTDSTGGTAQAHPVVTDSVGRAVVWLDDSLTYKLQLTNAAESQTYFLQDNVNPSTFVGFIIYPAGQGDQNLSTTDSPTFAGMTLTGALSGVSGTFSSTLAAQTITTTGNATVGGNIIVTGTVDGVDIAALKTDVDAFPDGLQSLSADEVTQLLNINSSTISSTQWGYLGAMNQGVTTTSDVAFNDISAAGSISVGGTVDGVDIAALKADFDALDTNVGGFDAELKNITASEAQQLQNIDSTTISTAQWVYVGDLDQALTTTDDVDFNSINGLEIDISGGAALGQALGFVTSTTKAEPYTAAGMGDMLKAANETITGTFTFSTAPDFDAAPTYDASIVAAARGNLGIRDVEDKAELLTKFAGASAGDHYFIGNKKWVKTEDDISSITTIDTDGVYAINRTGGDGTDGGWLADIGAFDLADPDLGIDFEGNNASTNLAKISRLPDIADAAQDFTTVGFKIVSSRSQGRVALDGVLEIDAGRCPFVGPGSAGFEFASSVSSGIAIQVGGSTVGFDKETFIGFSGATVRATNLATDAIGLQFKDCDRVTVEDAPQIDWAIGLERDNSDHMRLRSSPYTFQNRTKCALYAMHHKSNPDSDTVGYNTVGHRISHDVYPNDLFQGICLTATIKTDQVDGDWSIAGHTFGAAVGLWIEGKPGTSGNNHAVSVITAGEYFDTASVCNVLMTGDNVKAPLIHGQFRDAGNHAVLDRDLTAPPGSPAVKDLYLIAASATGAWAGQDGNFTAWDGSEWKFLTPISGQLIWVKDENKVLQYNGSTWTELTRLKGGVGIQVVPDVGGTITKPQFRGMVWQASRQAARFDDMGDSTIEHLDYDLQCYECNADEINGIEHIYVNVDSGAGRSSHGGPSTVAEANRERCVRIPSGCGNDFVIMGVAQGDMGFSDTYPPISDARTIASIGKLNLESVNLLRAEWDDRLALFGQEIRQQRNDGQTAIRGGVDDEAGAWIELNGENKSTEEGDFILGYGGKSGVGQVTGKHHDGTSTTERFSIDRFGVATFRGYQSGSVTVGDDAVGTIAVPGSNSRGMLAVMTDAAQGSAIFYVETDDSGYVRFQPGTSSTYYTGSESTGDLTGTSGSDGDVTLQVNGDGNVHIENRSGTSETFHYTWIVVGDA